MFRLKLLVMKKITLFLIVAFMAFGYSGWGQDRDTWTEDFNTQTSNQYGTGTITINSRVWSRSDAGNFSYANTNMGSYAFTINDDKSGAQITTPALNTCGTVSFKYAYINGNSTNVFVLQKSTDGTTYTDLDTHTLGASSNLNYVEYSYDVNDNSASVYIRILSNNQNAHLFIDDYSVTDYSGTGPDNPTSFTATTASTTQIDLSWVQNGNSNNVMVAWTSDGTFGTPSGSYTPGDPITGGGTVVYNGSSTSYNHTSLTSGTQYYYKAWSVDGTNTYSSGVTDDATTYKDQPSNHVTSFAALVGTPAYSSIDLSWIDATGTVLPDAYLIKGSDIGFASITAPSDGTPESDGGLVLNIAQGTQSATYSGLNESTTYYFKIWPYSNSGTAINYKTDGTVPIASETTTTANTNLIISEVSDPGDNTNGRFIELFNMGISTIDFNSEDWYLVKQVNGATQYDFKITGSVSASNTFVVAGHSDFSTIYGFAADQINTQISGNGDDGYYLYYGGDQTSGTLIDAYGVIGEDGSGKPWEYEDTKAVRLNSVTSPNTTWTDAEWDIPSSADVADMTPSEYRVNVTWQGTTDNDWNTKGTNWSGTYGFIPDASFNVNIPATGITNYPTISSEAACNDLTIQSSSTGDGSLLGQGNLTAYGTVTTQRYISNDQWHGVSSPLDGATAQSLYSNTANVYLKYHTESTNLYTNVTSLGTDLGDMKGWMMWYDGASGETFDITGTLRTGTVGSADNLTRAADGNDNGWNFVGNPFPSSIDWDGGTWTKTNVGASIYLYNNGSWATWNGTTGTGMTSGNIAMGQGFFVEVTDGGGVTTGTLTMTDDVQVHSTVGFMKSVTAIAELVRLEVSNGEYTDETVIYFDNEATSGYDYQHDAHKLFSFNNNRPQIYSTANDNMSINVLPVENTDVPIDVRGLDGENMTIAATEVIGFGDVMLLDNANGELTNLMEQDYEFSYFEDITDRFLLLFATVGDEEIEESNCDIYSINSNIRVTIHNQVDAEIAVFNIMGQKLVHTTATGSITDIPISEAGCYIVKVIYDNNIETTKVIIK